MPQLDRIARRMIFGLGLLAGGCDPSHKEAVRKDDPAGDKSAWSEAVVTRGSKGPAASSGDPDVEKSSLFGGKMRPGGLDDTSRDIERSLGVR